LLAGVAFCTWFTLGTIFFGFLSGIHTAKEGCGVAFCTWFTLGTIFFGFLSGIHTAKEGCETLTVLFLEILCQG